jgi:hypothetical protein
MLNHFRILPFLAGLCVGAAFLFFYKSSKTLIYEYPHPQNGIDRVYRDKNGACYTYTSEEVNCDANEKSLKPYPIQS